VFEALDAGEMLESKLRSKRWWLQTERRTHDDWFLVELSLSSMVSELKKDREQNLATASADVRRELWWGGPCSAPWRSR